MLEAKDQGHNAQVFSKNKKSKKKVLSQIFREISSVLQRKEKKRSSRKKSQILREILGDKKAITLAHF